MHCSNVFQMPRATPGQGIGVWEVSGERSTHTKGIALTQASADQESLLDWWMTYAQKHSTNVTSRVCMDGSFAGIREMGGFLFCFSFFKSRKNCINISIHDKQ